MMTLYTWIVNIHISGKKWGEYEIIAPSDQGAALVAGMKYQREEGYPSPGDIIYCDVIRIGDKI
jgi:hypothetical protein